MLRAVKSGTYTSKDGERTTIKAGVTGVVPAHWLAREYPEAFRVADSRDAHTTREHQRSLAHVREELERGRSTTTPEPGCCRRAPAARRCGYPEAQTPGR